MSLPEAGEQTGEAAAALADGAERARPRDRLLFVSYRRRDTGGWAGRVHEVLAAELGAHKVFMDVDDIHPGDEWRGRIEDALHASAAVVVLIGPDWAGPQPDGTRRLDQPNDIVRFEVATALRSDALVIPALVGEAELPEADELPAELLALRDRNAIRLDPSDLAGDTHRIVEAVAPRVGRSNHRRRRVAAIAVMTVLAVAAVLTVAWVSGRSDETAGGDSTVAAAPASTAAPTEPPVTPMSGDYNVAVAPFSDISGDGTVVDSADGSALAASVFSQLDASLTGLGGFELDSRGPEDVPSLAAPTSAARAEQAATIAEELRADVVLYGLLDRRAGGTTLQPELFVAPRQIGDAFELAGQYELGGPIVQPVDIAANAVARQAVREDLLSRNRSILELLVGLAHLSIGDRQAALARFQAADVAWPHDDGRAVFKLFEGNAVGELGDLAGADALYQAGLALDPDSPRLLLGRAEVAYNQLQPQCLPGLVGRADLQPALDLYGAAAAAPDQPELADIEVRVAFGRGRALACLGLAGEAGSLDEATALLTSVTTAYDGGLERVADIAAEAHSWLGLLHIPEEGAVTDEQARAALAEYEAAARIAPAARRPERAAFYWEFVGSLRAQLGDVDGAREAYDEAIALTEDEAKRSQLEADLAALASS